MSIATEPTDTLPAAAVEPPAPWVRRIVSIISRGATGIDEHVVSDSVAQVWRDARNTGRPVTDGIAVHRTRLAILRPQRTL